MLQAHLDFEGSAAFVEYRGVLHSILFPTPSPHFRSRLYGLIALMSYLIVAALANILLLAIDSRRRQRSVWLYRLVRRPSGRFIVGNAQLLGPVVSLATGGIYLVHLVNEYQMFYADGSANRTYALRLAPYTLIFLHGWLCSFASFQAFILTSRRPKALGWLTARVANGTFVGLGVAGFTALVSFVAIETHASNKIWYSYLTLSAYLDGLIAEFPNGVDNIDPATQLRIDADFSSFFDAVALTVHYTYGLLAVFIVTPFATACVNLGSVALIFVLRRQINFGFGRYEGRFDTQAGVDLEDHQMDTGGNRERAARLEFVEDKGSVSSEGRMEEMDHLPTMLKESSELGTSNQRRLSLLSIVAPQLNLLRHLSSLPDTCKQERSIDKDEKESPVQLDAIIEENEAGYRLNLRSRALRKLFNKRRSEFETEETYNHLKDLVRAERDLISTSATVILVSIAYSAIAIWILLSLSSVEAPTWKVYELELFLGAWLYGSVVSIALSFNLFTAYRNMSSAKQQDAIASSLDAPPGGPSSTGTPHPSSQGPDDDSWMYDSEELDEVEAALSEHESSTYQIQGKRDEEP